MEEMMGPIETSHRRGPGDFILPIRYEQHSASGDPVLVEWWMWAEATTMTGQSCWVHCTAFSI